MAKKIGIPRGMPALTPQLHFNGRARKAVEWYQRALGAELMGEVVPTPDGKGVMHAMLRVGDSPFMAVDVWPGYERGPTDTATVGMWLYTEDCDRLWERAISAGGTEVLMPMSDMFWGDRMGKLKDPFGHTWSIATALEISESEKRQLAAEQLPK